MKRIVINLGVEKTTVITYKFNRKVYKFYGLKSISNADYYKENGTLAIEKLVDRIVNDYAKSGIKKYDVQLVLPEQLTTVQYRNTSDLSNLSDRELPELQNSKLKNVKRCAIGDNTRNDITQLIYFNKNSIDSIADEFYKFGIPVIEEISSFSALHSSLPLFLSGESEYSGNDTKARIMISLGALRTNFILSINNLPVYIKESETSIHDILSNIKLIYDDINFSDILTVISGGHIYVDNDGKKIQRVIDRKNINTHNMNSLTEIISRITKHNKRKNEELCEDDEDCYYTGNDYVSTELSLKERILKNNETLESKETINSDNGNTMLEKDEIEYDNNDNEQIDEDLISDIEFVGSDNAECINDYEYSESYDYNENSYDYDDNSYGDNYNYSDGEQEIEEERVEKNYNIELENEILRELNAVINKYYTEIVEIVDLANSKFEVRRIEIVTDSKIILTCLTDNDNGFDVNVTSTLPLNIQIGKYTINLEDIRDKDRGIELLALVGSVISGIKKKGDDFYD